MKNRKRKSFLMFVALLFLICICVVTIKVSTKNVKEPDYDDKIVKIEDEQVNVPIEKEETTDQIDVPIQEEESVTEQNQQEHSNRSESFSNNNKQNIDSSNPTDKQPPKEPTQKPQDSAKPEKPTKPMHTHTWVEQTKQISHPATGHDEKVLVKEAWIEEIPVYETVAVPVCNVCKKEIIGEKPWEHGKNHALAGEGSGHHTEYVQKQTGTKTVTHQAEYTTKWVEDQAAWTETKVTGYKCSCGAEK